MESNINLLKRAQTPQVFKKKVKRILAIIATLAISLFTLASLTFFLLNYFLTTKIADLERKIKANETQINSLVETEATLWTISDKLTALEKILGKKTPLEGKIEKLTEILPAGVFFSEVSVSETTFSVSATAARLSDLNQFIAKLILPGEKERSFRKVVLEGLNISEGGLYTLNISGEIL